MLETVTNIAVGVHKVEQLSGSEKSKYCSGVKRDIKMNVYIPFIAQLCALMWVGQHAFAISTEAAKCFLARNR